MIKISNSALLVIDVQNYFFEDGSYAFLGDSKRIIKPINFLIDYFSSRGKSIVFTRQIYPMHPEHPMRKWWRRLPEGEECNLFSELSLPERYKVIEKEDYSAFYKTGLNQFLRKQKITQLFFCGVMTHLCVETSIRDAFMLGYECFLVEDATCSKNINHHRASILNLKHGFCRIIKSGDIYECV